MKVWQKICNHNLVERLNLKIIHFETETIFYPLSLEQKTNIKKGILNATAKMNVHVFVIDDLEEFHTLAKTIFEVWKVNLHTAHNGIEAIKKFSALRKKALVIMDIQMPKMNGFEATKILRKNFGYSFPIFGWSADCSKKLLEKGLSLGMNGWIPKPVHFSKFDELLYQWILFKNQSSISNQKTLALL